MKSEVCPLFFRLGAEGMLERELTHAGFGALHPERLAYELRFDGDDAVCEAVFAGGPVALAYGRFDTSTRRAAQAEFLAYITAHRHGRGYTTRRSPSSMTSGGFM